MAEEDDPLTAAVAGAVTTLVLLVAFGLLFAGVSWFWVVFPVGFGGLLPLALGATRLYRRREMSSRTTGREEDEALATLRDRYARGELTEAEFERQVERLLETEDAETARDRPTPDGARERDRETE